MSSHCVVLLTLIVLCVNCTLIKIQTLMSEIELPGSALPFAVTYPVNTPLAQQGKNGITVVPSSRGVSNHYTRREICKAHTGSCPCAILMSIALIFLFCWIIFVKSISSLGLHFLLKNSMVLHDTPVGFICEIHLWSVLCSPPGQKHRPAFPWHLRQKANAALTSSKIQ